jgi:hypothetical protein
MGTYNFYPPTDGVSHGAYDVFPYALYGNTKDDIPSSVYESTRLALANEERYLGDEWAQLHYYEWQYILMSGGRTGSGGGVPRSIYAQ